MTARRRIWHPWVRVHRVISEVLGVNVELGMRPLVADCHAGLAKLYRRTGKRTESDEHMATATGMYRDRAMAYWLERELES